MSLKEYLKLLNDFAKKNPKALEFEVFYASDDEGNSYSSLCYTPSVGYYDEDEDNFIFKGEFKEYGIKLKDANAICIN